MSARRSGNQAISPPRLVNDSLEVTATLVRFVIEDLNEIQKAWDQRFSRIPPIFARRVLAFKTKLEVCLKDYENHMPELVVMLTDLTALQALIAQLTLIETQNQNVNRDPLRRG